MNNIVVYESKYGSTERYAKWIGEELNCKVARISDVPIDELIKYDNIIICIVYIRKNDLKSGIKINLGGTKNEACTYFYPFCAAGDGTAGRLRRHHRGDPA